MSRFAREKVQPLVMEMDEKSHMDKTVISGLFEQGVRGGREGGKSTVLTPCVYTVYVCILVSMCMHIA